MRITLLACLLLSLFSSASAQPSADTFTLAVFSADVTPPIGHPCMGGGIAPVKRIDDPLFAHGFVLLGAGKPIVLVAVDWCEIRNDAYERWRSVLAQAAGTDKVRVLVTSLHQHDAPIADLEAQRLLERHKAKGQICDLDFHEKAVQRVAKALRDSLKSPRRVTHLGTGQAKVEQVASNRRYLGADGKPRFGRTSASRDPKVRAEPEGTIDPWLKTLSFWDGDRPVLALSCYATHPMSYYGQGGVSSDFVGLARKRRQADDPHVAQIYVSGCSGNVTAGKYNDGSPENRPVLADRIYQAMLAAWKATERMPLDSLKFRSTRLRLEPRDSSGFTEADLQKRLATDARPFGQCLAALGLSWRKRADNGTTIDVPCLDFGKAHLILMPAEAYVEYQLLAQRLRPDSFVVAMGYGECAPGYIPTEKAVAEGDGNLSDWCWVAPGVEKRVMAALETVLAKEGTAASGLARPHAKPQVAQGVRGQAWKRHVIDDATRGADGARLADVNGDRLLDVTTGWEEGGQVRVCLNPGPAKARDKWPAVTVGKVGSPEDAVFADLDGDGALDVVSCCEGKTKAVFVHWAPKDKAKYLDPSAWKTEAIPAVKDMTQWMFCESMQIDGKHGVAVGVGGKNQAGQIGWLQAPANPRDLAAWKYHPLLKAGWIMSLVSADMDDDGDLDLVVSDRRGKTRGCLWLENPGPGPEQTKAWRVHRIGPGGDEVMFLDLADLDGDGLRDVLVPTFDRKLHFFRRKSAKPDTWEHHRIEFPANTGSGKAVRVADLNLDGKLDLVLACANAGRVSGIVWLSYRKSVFDPVWDVHEISGPEGIKFDLIQLVDLDGDGDLDIINTEEQTGKRGLGVVWYENPTK